MLPTDGSEFEEERQDIINAAAGDTKAFEKLVSRHERRIFAHLMRLVGRREDAEDLSQETFMKAFLHLKDFDLEKRFSPWLYTIATRTAYDWLRKHHRREVFTLNDDERSNETSEIDDAYIRIASHHDLELALARLKPEYQTVLLLFYRDGLTYPEIAESLARPLSTIKTHLRRAKIQLRENLEHPSATSDPLYE